MTKKMAVVYQHIRLDTNEVFYVGWGMSEKRAYEYGRNEHWERVVKKAGYKINIFALGLSPQDAKEVEISEIERIGRSDLGLGPLVNKTNGGDGTIKVSKESINRMRLKKIGKKHSIEHRNKISQANKNKKRSEESKIKYRESKLGDKNPSKRLDVKNKISNSLKGRTIVGRIVLKKKKPNIVKCPFCNKEGNNNGGQMVRWHFNNCKSKYKAHE